MQDLVIKSKTKDKDSGETTELTATVSWPETVAEASEMWGEENACTVLAVKGKIYVQDAMKRAFKAGEDVQEAANACVPGAVRRRASATPKATLEKAETLFSSLSQDDKEAYIARLQAQLNA